MNEEKDSQSGSLLSSQEPHQKEELDQATKASAAAFNLVPDKGITPDPDEYNKGEEQGNIKQGDSVAEDSLAGNDGALNIDVTTDNADADAGEFDVTQEDLDNLNAQDRDPEQEDSGL